MEEVGKLKVICWQVKRGGTFKGIRESKCGELICPFNNLEWNLGLVVRFRSASESSLRCLSTGK